MDDNKIVKDSDDQNLELTNPSINCDGLGDGNVSEEPNNDKNDRDLHVIHRKRLELDTIQKGLDDLMCRLNSFIADSQKESGTDKDGVSMEKEEMSNVTEKQDGPAEKELRLNTSANGENLASKVYTTDDGSNPPEINWDAVGPILQKHVADLQRLRNLNQMTNAMVKRIRNVTQINDALLKDKKEDGV